MRVRSDLRQGKFDFSFFFLRTRVHCNEEGFFHRIGCTGVESGSGNLFEFGRVRVNGGCV